MIQANFYNDWIEFLRDKLGEMGFEIPQQTSSEEIAHYYFNAILRQISSVPRNIQYSSVFKCPENLKNGLTKLQDKIRKGDNINQNLSKKIKDIDYNDGLLNDWGIYHFHLGEDLKCDGFIQRTGPIMFAFVTPSEIYCIQIYSHGGWTNREVIEIIHNEWPYLIERYKLKGISGLSATIKNADLKILRSKNVNTFLEMADKTVYAPPGGGMMTSGLSAKVLMESDRYANKIKQLEKFILGSPSNIIDALSKNGHDGKSTVNFKLQIDEEGFWGFSKDFSLRVLLCKIKS